VISGTTARFFTERPVALVVLALVTGAFGACAHAPFDFAAAILIPLVAGFILLSLTIRVRDALWTGWALGMGYFGLTLTWITEPFKVDAALTGWMAPFALVLLAALLGAFWAVAVAFARWAGGHPVALVFAWTGAELARAYVFTGFPWASPPQALVSGLAGQGLAWGGPHGVMLACAAFAAAIATTPALWVRGAIVIGGAALILIPPLDGPSRLTDHIIRLVQPNAPQDEKWDPAMVPVFINRQIGYTGAAAVPDLVVWPETALPYLQENAEPVFDEIAKVARGALVVLGIQRRQDRDYFNSLVVLDAQGDVVLSYDKHHLVPLGEYMPFASFFRRIEIGGLAARVENGYAAGPGPQLLDLSALGTALPLICYEAVFAHDVGGTSERPSLLLQLTNDAWFGQRSGPQQHLAQARMRAIEQGLPLIRSANTGISAVIDPKGRVTNALALNTAGYMDAALPAAAAPTVYSRSGDWPWVLIVALGLIAIILQRSASRRASGIDAERGRA
jgi:apolipoprotein N-acyltransferase